MVEGIVLGTIQGVTEWLPISSEAVVLLVKARFFGNGESLTELIQFALFLHLGTFSAAAWYLRDDVLALFKKALVPYLLFREGETERMFRFLALATMASGVLGFFLLEMVLPSAEEQVKLPAKMLTASVGLLLLGTAFLQWMAKRRRLGRKDILDLTSRDGLLLGIIQGFTVLPGLSRSGLTISGLLLRGYNDTAALRMSFLMSLPAVLFGNIVLQIREGISLSAPLLFGFLFSFLFGIGTIHLLFRIARKVNFAYFVFFFGILTLVSVFL